MILSEKEYSSMDNTQYIKNTPHHYCKYQKTDCFKNEHELNIVYFIALSILGSTFPD